MGTKSLEIHPAAVAESKLAIAWYWERSQTAALKFVAELDRTIEQIVESPQRWPTGEVGTQLAPKGS